MYPLSRCYCCPPPPPEVRQCMPGSAVGSVAHKTHSSKSTNGFRYEMHETDRQTYCAAFLPHRVSSIANPPTPLSGYATVRHLHTRCYHNQLAIFLLLSSLSLSGLLSLLLVLICDMSSSSGSKCCFYQTPSASVHPLASTPLRTEAIWHC